jgi:spermidine synthase
MSSGYATGGWLADRYAPGKVLTWLLLGAGVWTLLLAGFGQPMVFSVSRWIHDPRWGPCFAAGVLLGIPAFGLSGVLPALLRLAIADMGHLGRHTGRMIAVSTIGSLVGTWGTSFFLLTWLGTMTLVAMLGVVLVILGLIWWWWARGIRGFVVGPVFLLLAYAGWVAFHPAMIQPPALHEEDSPYQQIRVRDNDLFRFLILNNTFHAIMWKVSPVQLALPYSQMMMAALGLHDSTPKRGLILGHGGGSLAKWLAHYWPSLEMDVVEMDPSVVAVAAELFAYKAPADHHVYVEDARTFLRAASVKYDVIWVDVFARHLIPFHLTTQEFFAELQMHLNPGGVVAVNLASSDAEMDQKRAEAVVTTLKTAFPHVERFSIPGPAWLRTSKGSANLIFFAKLGELQDMRSSDFSDRALQLVKESKMPTEVMGFLKMPPLPTWPTGVVFTDDFSPLDILQGSG